MAADRLTRETAGDASGLRFSDGIEGATGTSLVSTPGDHQEVAFAV